jgi:hypothetical protein
LLQCLLQRLSRLAGTNEKAPGFINLGLRALGGVDGTRTLVGEIPGDATECRNAKESATSDQAEIQQGPW